MIMIRYFANPHSIHVRHWLKLLEDKTKVEIFTIEPPPEEGKLPSNVICRSPLPKWMRRLPKIFRYASLGLYTRIFVRQRAGFHAHNSSGYGLTALISGHDYVLTTYGSEIFDAGRRGKFYRLLIHWVLRKATCITCASQGMLEILANRFAVERERISYFSLGTSPEFTEKPVVRSFPVDPDGRVWFANRRILPLYRTQEIVEAFLRFKNNGGRGRLILIKGDSSGAYFEGIRQLVAPRNDIDLVTEFLPPSGMIDLLDRCDFILSLPDSDQLSSSILEGMARGCVPILRDLASYDELSQHTLTLSLPEDGSCAAIESMFKQTASLQPTKIREMSLRVQEIASEHYSSAIASGHYRSIIELYLYQSNSTT